MTDSEPRRAGEEPRVGEDPGAPLPTRRSDARGSRTPRNLQWSDGPGPARSTRPR